MIAHVVLMTPKDGLSPDERGALVSAFERALREIPSVRGVRIGKRIAVGAHYESLSPDSGDYFVMIEFDDLDGLTAYLRHPAHDELGARFYQTLRSAMVFDYEVGGVERLGDLRPIQPAV
jgi:hypothetical protein